MKKLALSLIIAAIFAGCAAPPRENIKIAGGPYPDQYVEMIKCYLEDDLGSLDRVKDFAVQKQPEKIVLHEHYPSIPLREGSEVWECFVVYDVKNRYGNYIGKDLHVFWIRHGKLVAMDYEALPLEFRIKQRQGDPCK